MVTINADPRQLEQFTRERSRLSTALGEVTEGGIVENIQHIGSTSVPGLPPSPCIDLALSVWPFPLESQHRAVVERLGYAPVPGYEDAPEQRFRHARGDFQLFVVELGGEAWTNHLLIRDYLRSSPAARETYTAQRATLTGDSNSIAQLFEQLLSAARKWWVSATGFAPVEAVANELKDFAQPWYISSGWALDLFLGRVTRVHHDIDVVIARSDQLALQTFMTARGWKFVTPLEKRLGPWPAHMRLELPRHQAHAHRGEAFIDFLLTDIEQDVWRYRREPRIIRNADQMSLRTTGGISFLAPELVLLFKSKSTAGQARNKDQLDFEAVCERLEPERRAWLRWALAATEPAHPWIAQLI